VWKILNKIKFNRTIFWYPINLLLYLSLFFIKQKKGKERKEKIVAIVLSWKRVKNIPYVVFGLKKQSYIDEIIIFHNHPSKLRIPGCKNIFSEKNLGCIVRHKIASTIKGYDYFVFSDDDLMLMNDLRKDILPVIRSKGKESVLGFFGQELNMKKNKEEYTSGKHTTSNKEMVPIDIIKGRFHIISKEGISEMAKSNFNTSSLKSEDDIRANLIIQRKFKKPSYLIPLNHRILELHDKHALERRPTHLQKRNEAVSDALKLGWEKQDYTVKTFEDDAI